jgi:hypothetical protein
VTDPDQVLRDLNGRPLRRVRFARFTHRLAFMLKTSL